MADTYNEVKLALTTAKTGLTKAIKKLEERGKEMGNLEADLAMSSKVRVAASLLEAHDLVSRKNKEVSDNRDKWISSIIGYNPVDFEKNSKKTKEQLVEESERDVEVYEDKAEQLIKLYKKEIEDAEKLLAMSAEPKFDTGTKSNSETAETWSQFKPQQNLEPLHLES